MNSKKFILFGFAITVILFAILATISVKQLSEFDDKAKKIVNDYHLKDQLVSQMHASARERIIYVMLMYYTHDEFELEALNQRLLEEGSKFLSARETLLSMDLSKEERSALEKDFKRTVITGNAQREASEQLLNGNKAAAQLIINKKIIPNQDYFNLTSVKRIQKIKSNQALVSIESARKNTQNYILFLSIIILLIVSAINLFVLRQISRSENRLQKSNTQLAYAQQTLEKQVEARTQELLKAKELADQTAQQLADSNQSLQSQITQRIETEKQLEQMAHFDHLTHLPNRAFTKDVVKRYFAQAKRDKLKVAILFIDLDGFKAINDQFGHEKGDAVLVETAVRLAEVVRGMDLVSRFGGDEFVIILTQCESNTEIESVAKRLLKAIKAPYKSIGKNHQLGMSIGISVYPEDGTEFDLLVGTADQKMYQSKSSNTTKIHF